MKLPKDCLLEKICPKDATRTTLAAFSDHKNDIKVGDNVTVTELGVNAVVIEIVGDGNLCLKFTDGDEGSYSTEEVEALA